MAVTKDQATTLALAGLAFLAADEENMQRFLAATGLDPGSLRARADDPGLLLAVLDFLLGADEMVLAFCEENGCDPRRLHVARAVLEGDF